MKLSPYLLSVLLSAVLLQGCAGGLIIAAGTAVSVSSDERSIKQLIKDGDLEKQAIDAVVESDAYNDDMRINIIANNGYLLLIGQIQNQENSTKIEALINNIDGVAGVYNQLRINAPISLAQQSEDTWLTTKVKSQLTSHDKVNPLKIKVVTEDAEVFLIGQVTEEMSNYATSVASNVNGVKQVVKVFELIPAK